MNRNIQRKFAREIIVSVIDKGLSVKDAQDVLSEASMLVRDICLLAYREKGSLPLSDFRDQF